MIGVSVSIVGVGCVVGVDIGAYDCVDAGMTTSCNGVVDVASVIEWC